jgi:CubicO group peptidase (beta-lactamase class C family)
MRSRPTVALSTLVCLLGAGLAGLSCVASTPSAQARPPNGLEAARFGGVRALVERTLEEHGVPSVAVAVAQNGRILWEEGFGWADRERRRRATPHTMYSLASISKPFTAAGLMTLVEKGLVDLDRPINEYLGAGRVSGANGDPAAATVRRVLSHTAGLPLHYQFFYRNAGYGPPSMDETIARYGIIVQPPGELYHYSNLGYGILDRVIARVSNRRYADFMRTEVFLPLELRRTSVDIGPGLEEFAAERYDSQQRPIPFYEFDHPGGSALYSSAHDLVRFGMFALKTRVPGGRRILQDTTIDLMQTVATPGDPASGYGLGWSIGDDMGYRRVSHTGGMPGVTTVLNLFPEASVAIVVLANRGGAPVFRIAQEIAGVVLPRYARARAGRTGAPAAARRPPVPELTGVWTGTLRTYEGSLPLHLIFQPDGEVHARIADQAPAVVVGVSFQDGTLIGRFAGRIPSADQGRHAHSVLLHLRLRDGRLRGQAAAQTIEEPVYYALSSYVDLSQVQRGEP